MFLGFRYGRWLIGFFLVVLLGMIVSKRMTSKTLKLSIVIPVYNEQNYLKACLDSIAAQTVKPFEVLVVDNNSTDKSMDIAAAYPFVKILKESKQGTVFTRDRGFNAVRGDIIGRIDADTVLPQDWVDYLGRLFLKDANIMAVTGPCNFNLKFGGTALSWLHRIIYFWSTRLLFGHTTLFGSNMAFRSNVWNKVNREVCERTDVHEDMDLAHHIARLSLPIRFDRRISVTISAKVFLHGVHYPVMWIRTRLIHMG